jgi:5-methylcytosine-specific restriction enzyme subunit McrC
MEIPVANVYYLLCYAWDKLEEDKLLKVDPTSSTSLVDLFARVLIGGADHIMKKGLDRWYVAHVEELAAIRGRIQFQPTLKRALAKHGRVCCQFDELSYDVLHNQILKTTVGRLIKTDTLATNLRDQLLEHWRRLPEIHTISLSKQVFGKVQLHRNNYIYDFLLRICELLFDNLLPTPKSGSWQFRSFLQDEKQMAYLFESFIRNFYKREVHRVFGSKAVKVAREDIKWKLSGSTEEFQAFLPKMQTDVCITTDEKRIIVECKYTADLFEAQRFEGTQKLRSAHLYQVNSYLDNLPDTPLSASCRAILLYPVATRSFAADFTRGGGQAVSVRTVNLNQDWQDIERSLLNLVT